MSGASSAHDSKTKFPEEETCSLAQSEWSELNPCRSAITPALSQRVGVMSFIDRAENEVVHNPLPTPSFSIQRQTQLSYRRKAPPMDRAWPIFP